MRARICIPFHVADAPAQASIALCYSSAPCTQCTYHPRDGIPYDKRIHKRRDVGNIVAQTKQAAKYMRKRAQSRIVSGSKRKL